jgi:hypothetical protein
MGAASRLVEPCAVRSLVRIRVCTYKPMSVPARGSIESMTETLEWWPDYGAGLLFLRTGPGGRRVDPVAVST